MKDGTNTFVDTTSGHLVRFNQNLSLLGSIDQSIFYYINALEKTTDNGYLASGYYGIVKFSSSGMIEWKKMYKYPYVYSS
ncbi:MAG: hypothetical protein H6767_09505 [Candidatus Peribacteria bacterium]|nr:MAG: hypothetical protein H6767_09505 [Candidatus Peribacteria bacterium]